MEFFDYFTRLFGMDPTQLPVYLRVMTFIVPVAIVVYVICLVVRIVRKTVKAIRHVRLGVRTKEDVTLNDGETIGFSEDQKLPITLSKGIAISGESLKIAYPEK